MVSFNGVNHLAMATGDMDKTIRFWRDLLGMRLVAGLGKPGYRHYFFQLSDTDLVAFFEWSGVKPMPKKGHGSPVQGPFIFDHVSFGVETEDDLWELKDKLEAAGFEVSDVIDHGFIHSIYSFDPNGIPIEFSANVAGRDVRTTPTIIDSNPSKITLEGSEPEPDVWPSVKRPTPESSRFVYPGAGSELFHGKKKT
jgi:catechol 2,3-dioxygenase-like lactoylglutathione lyase family enzyme